MKSSIIVNVSSYVLLQFITVASGFIIPRLFLLEYGSELNGLVSSCTQFISYLTLLEMGISQAAVLALYTPMAKRSIGDINAIVYSIERLYKKIAIYYTCGMIILLMLYPYFLETNIDSIYIRAMLLILGVQNLLDYLCMGKYKAILIADQKQYIMVNAQTFMAIVCVIMSYFFITLHFDALIVKAIIPITYLARCLYIMIYVKKHYGFIQSSVNDNINSIKDRFYVLIHQISGLIVNSTDITLLTIIRRV